MVIAIFSMTAQAIKIKFFKETFLIANVSLDMIPTMSFLILSNTDIDFLKRELQWRSYTIEKTFFTTKWVELVRKKEFAATVLDQRHKIFVVHIAFFASSSNNQEYDVYLSHKAQIATLVANGVFISIPTKYSDFTEIFSLE